MTLTPAITTYSATCIALVVLGCALILWFTR